jgi:hypothetical protein
MCKSLPTYIKKEINNLKFVKVLRNYLFENAFYLIEEFYRYQSKNKP